MSSSSSSSYDKYDIRRRSPDPKSCALLVIDVQNYFSSMVGPILPSLHNTIRLCRRSSIPIIFTRHCHKLLQLSSPCPSDRDRDRVGQGGDGMLSEWWDGDLIVDGTEAAELIPQLDRRQGDPVIEKNTYSAFKDTGLEERLVGMGIREVIVTGVMTNLCCETTARDAFVRGFRVFFSKDATATSEEELHEAALKNLAYGFAYLVDCKALQQGLPGRSPE